MTHQISYRIYYEDTDAGGIVYHAKYLHFGERARTEFMREIGHQHSSMAVMFVVRRIEIDYLAPGRLDDLVTVKTSLQNISRAAITMSQDFYVGDKVLAKSVVVIVCVGRESLRPVSIPDEIKSKIGIE